MGRNCSISNQCCNNVNKTTSVFQLNDLVPDAPQGGGDKTLDGAGQSFTDNQTKYNSEQAEGGRVRQAQELGGGRKDCMGRVKP